MSYNHTIQETFAKENLTAKNTKISLNFLVSKFCGNAEFPQSFGRIAQNSAETVLFQKISAPENQVKLRCFAQCLLQMHFFLKLGLKCFCLMFFYIFSFCTFAKYLFHNLLFRLTFSSNNNQNLIKKTTQESVQCMSTVNLE